VITITTAESPEEPRRRRNVIAPLSISEIEGGDLQEGQDLDFKRQIDFDKPETKTRLLDDVVAFLNRGPSRIIVGVEERDGRFDGFRPMTANADKFALRVQTLIQDGITPTPADVEVVPLHMDGGFILDIRIPRHPTGPFMNRMTGGYLIRSGARNLPIDPGMLRSRFVDEQLWLRTLDELTAEEDARLAANNVVAPGRAFRIGILPRDHFDHLRRPFTQEDHVRSSAPSFSEGAPGWFKVCEDGHQVLNHDFNQRGIERLFVRDDWFIHAHASFALYQTSGEGRLALHEFDLTVKRYLKDLSEFLTEQEIEGPFAVTLALQSLEETENFGAWFRNTNTVRTLRPQIVSFVDDETMIADFLRRVRQASVYG